MTALAKMQPMPSRTRISELIAIVCGVLTLGSGTHAADTRAVASRTQTQDTATRSGCHAFDFELGKWKMPNTRLVKRLVGSHQWAHFYSYDVGSALPGCMGDIDIMRTNYWPHFIGVTVRTYDHKTGLWRIYWVDNHFTHGVIGAPEVGRFKGNVGVFYGKDTYEGIPVLVRFIWKVNPKGSKVAATWSQAFSRDGGKTWEVNWRNSLIPERSGR